MIRKTILLLISSIIFCSFIGIGLCIAAHKPLWLDELHTQYLSIQNRHTLQIITSGASDEGNSAPLYYVLQKWVNWVPGVQVSAEVLKDYIWADPKAQLILRINSILFMALALSILFYYFASTFSTWAGVYAILCSLASPMVWLYWAEARPYPLLLLLTVIQLVILIEIWKSPDNERRLLRWLTIVHILLVATSYLALIQVVSATFILVLFGQWSHRKATGLLIIPTVVAVFYRCVGAKLNYSLYFQWSYLIDNIPLDRIAFFTITATILYLLNPSQLENTRSDPIKAILKPYAGFFIASLIGIALLFLVIQLHKNPLQIGLHSRFFIFLTPVGIMFQVFLAIELWQRFCKNWQILSYLLAINIVLGAIACMNTSLCIIKELKYL